MNSDTSLYATIQRLSDELLQMEQENIQLRQQIIQLEENSILDMDFVALSKCEKRFKKEHPVESAMVFCGKVFVMALTIVLLDEFMHDYTYFVMNEFFEFFFG